MGHSAIGGGFYIAHMLSGQNTVLTGCRGDVMEEWDLAERKLVKSYEVPTGPASTYRMDDTTLVINRNGLVRWKRHEQSTSQGNPQEFTFSLHYPDSSRESYKFVHERLVVTKSGKVKLYDMNTNQEMWDVQVMERVLWNGLDMDYNRAILGAGEIHLLDLNNGEEILRIDASQNTSMICKLQGNTALYATTDEVAMVDLRNHEHKVWSVPRSSNVLKNIYFDEFKCIVGHNDGLMFFDTQTGKHLYDKYCPGLIDFACNDEYLSALAGRQHFVFDFTTRYLEKVHSVSDLLIEFD